MLKNLINENILVDLVWDKLVTLSKHYQKGTYNNADPTEFKMLEADVYIGNTVYNTYFDEETNCEYPGETILHVNAYDCTWGIGFKIKVLSTDFDDEGKEIIYKEIGVRSAGYWDRECFSKNIPDRGEWSSVKGEHFYQMMFDILTSGKKVKTVNDYMNIF